MPEQVVCSSPLKDREGSPHVVSAMLRMFDLVFYKLLHPGNTLSFTTPYILVQSVNQLLLDRYTKISL